jgi:hypothetical protein
MHYASDAMGIAISSAIQQMIIAEHASNGTVSLQWFLRSHLQLSLPAFNTAYFHVSVCTTRSLMKHAITEASQTP